MLAACKLATSEFEADVPGCFAYLRQRSQAAFQARDLRELNACASLLIAIDFPINDAAKTRATQLCVEWLTITNELLDRKEGFDDHAYFIQWTVLDVVLQWCLNDLLGVDFIRESEKIVARFIADPELLELDEPAIVLGLLSDDLKRMQAGEAQKLLQLIRSQKHTNIQRVLERIGL